MRHLVKTSIAVALFLVPLALLCTHPGPVPPELVPLPFKAEEKKAVQMMSLNELEKERTLVEKPPAFLYDPAAVPLQSPSDIQKMKKFSFSYAALEVKDRDEVRLKGARVGVDYHVDGQQSVGVEGSQQIYDRQDAKAWDEGGQDESTAGIKYKLIF